MPPHMKNSPTTYADDTDLLIKTTVKPARFQRYDDTSSLWTKILGYISEMWYIWTTRITALYHLCTISEKEYTSFIKSFELFDIDADWSEKGQNDFEVVHYYHVINHLCALGNVEKMYIPPNCDPDSGVFENQIIYERKMMADINIPAQANVLDIGCGRGRVACHVAQSTGAKVTGLNLDPSQIANGRAHTKRVGLEERMTFIQGSHNDPLPFPDESFDAAYNIQAFTYSKDPQRLFREIYRVLKPGAKFSYLDWAILPNYDPKNDTHVDLVKRTMPFIGAVTNPRVAEIEDACTKAGFKIIFSKDASIDGHQTDLIRKERAHYAWVRKFIRFGVKIGFVPEYFPKMMQRLREDAEAMNQADELQIATTSWQIVIEKPL